eukprot:6205758-Pleurochrysis_carterae.AAC.3
MHADVRHNDIAWLEAGGDDAKDARHVERGRRALGAKDKAHAHAAKDEAMVVAAVAALRCLALPFKESLGRELAVAYVDIASRPAAGYQLARCIGPEVARERVEVLPAKRVADEDEGTVLQQVHKLRQAALADHAHRGRGAAHRGQRPRAKRAGGALAHQEGRVVLAALGGALSNRRMAWATGTVVQTHSGRPGIWMVLTKKHGALVQSHCGRSKTWMVLLKTHGSVVITHFGWSKICVILTKSPGTVIRTYCNGVDIRAMLTKNYGALVRSHCGRSKTWMVLLKTHGTVLPEMDELDLQCEARTCSLGVMFVYDSLPAVESNKTTAGLREAMMSARAALSAEKRRAGRGFNGDSGACAPARLVGGHGTPTTTLRLALARAARRLWMLDDSSAVRSGSRSDLRAVVTCAPLPPPHSYDGRRTTIGPNLPMRYSKRCRAHDAARVLTHLRSYGCGDVPHIVRYASTT